MRILLTICAGALLSATPVDAQQFTAPPLGRLFYSPEERARLDQRRGVAEQQVVESPNVVAISGVIMRDGGQPIPVIGGRLLPAGETLSGLRIAGLTDGRVRITQPNGQSVTAKPGQTVDLASGQATDNYELPGKRDPRASALPAAFGSGTLIAPAARPAAAKAAKKAKRPTQRRGKAGPNTSPGKAPPIIAPPPPGQKQAPAPAIPMSPAMPALPAVPPVRP